MLQRGFCDNGLGDCRASGGVSRCLECCKSTAASVSFGVFRGSNPRFHACKFAFEAADPQVQVDAAVDLRFFSARAGGS